MKYLNRVWALISAAILATVCSSCSNDESKIIGQWEGQYRWSKNDSSNNFMMRFEENEVFCYEESGNTIAGWKLHGDSIIVAFYNKTTIRARLNADRTVMSGKMLEWNAAVKSVPGNFAATKKAASPSKSQRAMEPSALTGVWEGGYRYHANAAFIRFKLKFVGNEAYFYSIFNNTIASWELENDSIIMTIPGNVTIRGTVSTDRTFIEAKKFTTSDSNGEPGGIYAAKLKENKAIH